MKRYDDKSDAEGQKQYIGDAKQYIDLEKQYIEAMMNAGLSRKSTFNAMKLYSAFGLTRFFGRTEAADILGITATPASALLKKLNEAGILAPVPGMGKGKYRFVPEFFKSRPTE